MNLVFWLNSTFLHCSYLTLFTPQNFLISLSFSLSPGYYSRLKRTESEENSNAFFFFLGGGGRGVRLVAKKAYYNGGLLKKKATLLG